MNSFTQKASISLVFVFSFLSFSAQELHSPAEIFKILEESKLTYQIEILGEEVETPDRTENLNFNDTYRVEEDDKISSKKYELSKEANKHYLLAENHFKKGEYDKAKEKYLKILEVQPNYYKVMTYMGQIYHIQKNEEEAITWYKKAIESNYIDYMAHWFLASSYQILGNKEEAAKEIVIAQILNRNNPRIKKSYNEILKESKLKTDDWMFTPQLKLDSLGPNAITIEVGENWMGYGLVKAVWAYEPGYREKMGGSSSSVLEEKEAILSLASAFDKKLLKKNPEFKALNNALENNLIDEFILYEIVLPEYPFVAYQLEKSFIESIADYVIKIRGKG